MAKSLIKAAFPAADRATSRGAQPGARPVRRGAHPGFVRGGDQILFVQPRPDVLWVVSWKSLNFSLMPWRAISRSGLTFASRLSSSG